MLEGAVDGIKKYLSPTFSKLANLEVCLSWDKFKKYVSSALETNKLKFIDSA